MKSEGLTTPLSNFYEDPKLVYSNLSNFFHGLLLSKELSITSN